MRSARSVQEYFYSTRTVAASVQVNYASNAHVDNTKEALILLLEFLLIKNLNGENAFLRDSPEAHSVST
nr:hypothetical protein CFP56_24001 [Quercus suber]